MKGILQAVRYQWLKYFHIVSALGFVGIHGASMVVLYVVRGERDRKRIQDLLAFSSKTVMPMYLSLAGIVLTGVLLGFEVAAFRRVWLWLSIGLLAVTGLLMWGVAKPFTARVRAACELRPSGVPRVSDEELGELLRSPRSHLITAIGIVGLAGILYLMLFRPVF